QDGHRRPSLADQRQDPDSLGADLHPRCLRLTTPRLAALGVLWLVLTDQGVPPPGITRRAGGGGPPPTGPADPPRGPRHTPPPLRPSPGPLPPPRAPA